MYYIDYIDTNIYYIKGAQPYVHAPPHTCGQRTRWSRGYYGVRFTHSDTHMYYYMYYIYVHIRIYVIYRELGHMRALRHVPVYKDTVVPWLL